MKTFKFLFFLVIFFSIVGFVFAMFWDIPRPAEQVQKPISLNITKYDYKQVATNNEASETFDVQ